MPSTSPIILFFGLFVTFCALSAPAEAIRIKNRDDIPHQVAFIEAGSEHVVELPPGRIFTTHTPAATLRLLTGEHPSRHQARFSDEYTIWPDGHMHLQKRRWPEHRAFD